MNNKIEKALRHVKESHWIGGINIQPTIKHALKSMNFSSPNSGNYEPTSTKIDGVGGLFMLNEDGSIHYEVRAIELDSGSFLIEYLSNEGFDEFESAYYAS